MAERDFASRLRRVGFARVDVVERRPWGIEDCRRYPLFDAELIALMRLLVDPQRHDRVADVVTLTGRRPDRKEGAAMTSSREEGS